MKESFEFCGRMGDKELCDEIGTLDALTLEALDPLSPSPSEGIGTTIPTPTGTTTSMPVPVQIGNGDCTPKPTNSLSWSLNGNGIGNQCQFHSHRPPPPTNLFPSPQSSLGTEELLTLLQLFSKTTYRAKDSQPKITAIMDRCLSLFALDYQYSILSNTSGELSTNYPSKLVILESEKPSMSLYESLCSCSTNRNGTAPQSQLYNQPKKNGARGIRGSPTPPTPIDSVKLKELCSRARLARCRARFPVPVILYNKKHICRSATLSGGPEIYGRSSFDYFFSTGGGSGYDESGGGGGDDDDFPESSETGNGSSNQSDWQLFDRVRSQDIRLLKTFNVQTIVDLMVEKKKVKFGVNVTSSEKVDKEKRYADFNIVSLPYPGCEFFKEFRDNGYRAEELIFQWNQGHVDAHLCVPPSSNSPAATLDCNWSHYRNWDLVLLSQNYLKLLLAYMNENCEGGLLIHCISGWDRTPLFISLLRLSLWADGAIHQSLDSDQILYLTLAYDWLLFGHNLEDRLSKGEEILSFCFHFLKYIVGPDFSVGPNVQSQAAQSTNHSQSQLSRVRNDSDCHLEGSLLLLDGVGEGPGLGPTAAGSNWSLNSSGSSSVSVGSEAMGPCPTALALPPSSFQVDGIESNGTVSCTTAESWEDCSLQNPSVQAQASKFSTPTNPTAYPKLESSSSCILTASIIQDTTPTLIPTPAFPNYQSNANNHQPQSSIPTTTTRRAGLLGTTSTRPIAVPLPATHTTNRLSAHSNSTSGRPESNSSASIGSWQLITGPGSLRDSVGISTSDPSHSSSSSTARPVPSNSHHLNLELFDGSESSCTLVDELDLTPIDTQPSLLLLESCLGLLDTPTVLKAQTVESETELALGLALLEEPSGGGSSTQSTTATTTPTKEEIESCFTNNNDEPPSITQRREKLEKVRSRFNTLYQRTVGRAWSLDYDSTTPTNPPASKITPQESQQQSTATGLGFFIGNFANRVVGNIRTSTASAAAHGNRIVNP